VRRRLVERRHIAATRPCTAVSSRLFALFDPVTLTLTFWLNIHWWARYRDRLSLCQVWRFYFQPFWFYRAERQTESQRRMIAILTRLPSVRINTLLSVSEKCCRNLSEHFKWFTRVPFWIKMIWGKPRPYRVTAFGRRFSTHPVGWHYAAFIDYTLLWRRLGLT